MSRVYSVGHSNRGAEELIGLLRASAVELLVDVRRIPASGRHPWFGRRALEGALADAGIAYLWLGEGLGGRRAAGLPPQASANGALRDAALRAYADSFASDAFRRDLSRLEAESRQRTTALLCAERDWRRCHRQLLCDVLSARGIAVEHLRDAEHKESHVLNEWARIEDGEVTYPALV